MKKIYRFFVLKDSPTHGKLFWNPIKQDWYSEPSLAVGYADKTHARRIADRYRKTGETWAKMAARGISIVRGFDDGKAWVIEL